MGEENEQHYEQQGPKGNRRAKRTNNSCPDGEPMGEENEQHYEQQGPKGNRGSRRTYTSA